MLLGHIHASPIEIHTDTLFQHHITKKGCLLAYSPCFETFHTYSLSYENAVLLIIGRIDNLPAIRQHLVLFPLASPEAVLLAAFKQWGTALAEKLIGDFYVIIWQEDKQQCHIATSPSPLTPLFYSVQDQGLIFSNHFPTLKKQLHTGLTLQPRKIVELLLYDFQDPQQTYYQEIQRLPAGHQLNWRQQHLTVRRFWTPSSNNMLEDHSAEDCHELIHHTLKTAIDCRLPYDKKCISTQLSGGLDSSAITAMAATHYPDHTFHSYTSVPPHGFTFPHHASQSLDDRHLAQTLIDQHPNLTPHWVEENPQYALSETTRFLLDHTDGPTQNAFNFPWFYRTFQLSAQHGAPLLLTGAMGNLTLSWSGLKTHFWNIANKHLDYSLARISQWGQTDQPWWLEETILKTSALKHYELGQLKPHFHHYYYADNPAWYVQDYFDATAETIGLTNAMRFNTGVLDIDPTADQRLIELCLRIPQRHFRKGSLSRTMVRLGLAAYLPPAIRFNPTRGLQCTTWFYQLKATLPYYWQHFEQYRQCDTIQQLLDLTSLETLMHQAATVDPFDFDPNTLYQEFFNKLGRSLHVCDWLYHFERQ